MFLPFRDHNPSGSRPYVTWILIAANLVVFVYYAPILTDEWAISAFWHDWAMMPVEVVEGRQVHTVFTSMFLHAGYLHIGGNMLFLWIFGDNIEDALGHAGFLCFYVFCGLAASLAHVVASPWSDVPTIGASGAVAGVMGAYLLLFPRARVDVLFFLVVIFRIFSWPAWVVLCAWAAFQFHGGLIDPGSGGGVAYWAHVGGFLAGMFWAAPCLLRRRGTSGRSRKPTRQPAAAAPSASSARHGGTPGARPNGPWQKTRPEKSATRVPHCPAPEVGRQIPVLFTCRDRSA